MGQGTHPNDGTAGSYSSTPLVPQTDNKGNPTPTPFDMTNAQVAGQFNAAQADRQSLADDIYRRLLAVTGVPAVATAASPTPAELAPRRWLAQLAVNIVDFIDEDDISTPFNFYTTTDAGGAMSFNPNAVTPVWTSANASQPADQLPTYWVYGTELPRVVINEVMSEYQLPPMPQKGGMNNPPRPPFNIQSWVELYNPLPTAAGTNTQPLDNVPVPLFMPTSGTTVPAYSPYQILIAANNPTAQSGGLYYTAANMNDNVLGSPYNNYPAPANPPPNTPPRATANFIQNVGTVANPTGSVAANVGAGGYFLAGPASKSNNGTGTAGQDRDGTIVSPPIPGATPWLQSPGMEYTVTPDLADKWTLNGQNIDLDGNTAGGATPNGLTVLLRRVANPYLPPVCDPTKVDATHPWNPYVTTDYVQGIVPTNATVTNTTPPVQSLGKLQPYASGPASSANWKAQTQAVTVNGTQTQTSHTFAQQNVPVTSPFNWLVHLDRELISPMELLQVSGYQPHDLTHRFLPPNQAAYGHLAPWFDETTRLYRVFEFLGTHDRFTGVAAGGRTPGMVNINTIWDQEVLLALCDPQAANGFKQTDVNNIFTQLMTLRSPSGTPAQGDRPFLGMGVGVLPPGDPQTSATNGQGINDTFLRSNTAGVNKPTDPRLFQLTGANYPHPYQQDELLTKIFNSVTTKSNVFAVWCTVGFFQVTDDTAQPPKLGAEITNSSGATVRRQFFCIVDRSNLTTQVDPSNPNAGERLQGPEPWFATGNTAVPAPGNSGPQPVKVSYSLPTGTSYDDVGNNNRTAISIQANRQVWVDVGNNQEQVTVTATTTNPATFTAKFTKAHGIGFPITNAKLGNPGPQPKFDYTLGRYRPVVRYFAYLQ
jgi:hypothetical protein